jgi:hypothetical protein
MIFSSYPGLKDKLSHPCPQHLTLVLIVSMFFRFGSGLFGARYLSVLGYGHGVSSLVREFWGRAGWMDEWKALL